MKNKLVENGIIPSVNYHLWKACNYRCKFCFGSFNDVKNNNLKQVEAENLLKKLVDFGFEKITFSGGEPTLCPFLPKLLEIAKKGGMTTMIVTNGSKLDFNWLQLNSKFLDWIALSIDSVNEKTNTLSGRYNGKLVFDELQYLSLIKMIKDFKYKLKINTVVSRFNVLEDMNEFINKVNPNRWKIMQALPIKGQNDKCLEDFVITDKEFNIYLNRHKTSNYIKENNYDMRGSYLMIDPIGRFFENINGIHKYSSEINTVGVKQAMTEINYCFKKFINRDGIYNWV